jgi:hypothetical protein
MVDAGWRSGLAVLRLGCGHPQVVFEPEFRARVIESGGAELVEEMLDCVAGTPAGPPPPLDRGANAGL